MRKDYRRITFTRSEVEHLYAVLKELDEEEEAIIVPAWNENHNLSLNCYFLRGCMDNHLFRLTLQRKGLSPEDMNFTVCFFDSETNSCLGRLDLGHDLKCHRNADGTLIKGPHFHYYPDGFNETISFEDFLKHAEFQGKSLEEDDFVAIIILFLCYINLDRKGTPVTEALL